eukprot:CAMPEP_0180133920 /NCGR_PEP_ID=MMETSP0986-20121125/9825_1 /TAXON_ID=697907 /ORGANISM="non described non described, Strain CCMP2293" /LENGTH=318 /DNA_ID=CAMNT_0022074125 /DNA_START=52 /DNA_END=1008 /DNA_ORIENTATION=-
MTAMEGDLPADVVAPINFSAFDLVGQLPQPPAASGQVYHMRAPQSAFDCAFKVIPLPMDSMLDVANSVAEIRKAWQPRHQNIALFLDCEHRADVGFVIATEYLDAHSLRDHMEHGRPIPEQVVGGVVAQAVAGLAHLHHMEHVAHRDIKPSNILLSMSGIVKVTDLCQSRQLSATFDNMATYLGTQVYMSPERISGAPYTTTCDVWSLALVAVEALLGRYPYFPAGATPGQDGMDAYQVLEAVMAQPEPRLDESFSPHARDFCAQALVKAKERRADSVALLQHGWVTANQPPTGAAVVAEWLAARQAANALPLQQNLQ